jgi:microcystin-dependent protein
MAIQLKDRVKTGFSTVGTGDIVFGATRDNFQGWDAVENGKVTYYCITTTDQWEVGYGLKSATNLARNVIASSTGSLLDLAGAGDVFLTYPGDYAVVKDQDGNVEIDGDLFADNIYTKTEIDTQQQTQDDAVEASQEAQDGVINNNTANIGTLSTKVTTNTNDIERLKEGVFFSSSYTCTYPANPNRDPEAGNMYLQNLSEFTYNYADTNNVFISKTDEQGNVRQFTAVQVDDVIVLNQVESANFGRYLVNDVQDVGDYVQVIVEHLASQGTVIDGEKIAIQAFPAAAEIWTEPTVGTTNYVGDVTISKDNKTLEIDANVAELGVKSRITTPLQLEVNTKDGSLPDLTVNDGRVDVRTSLYVNNVEVGTAVGNVPIGAITLWMGAAAPTNWAICDGTNGTPDMRGLLPIGVSGSYGLNSTGGSADAIAVTHSHTASTNNTGAHTHSLSGSTNTTGNHAHSISTASGKGQFQGGGYNANAYSSSSSSNTNTTGNHSHSLSGSAASAGNHTHTVTVNSGGASGTGKNLPPYRAVNYIMRIS